MILPLQRLLVRRLRILFATLALIGAVGFAGIALATPIDDLKAHNYSYGGYTCAWGARSYLAAGGGSSGYAGTVIVTSECTNGYRELYTAAVTTTNGHIYWYSDWLLYNFSFAFYGQADLCEIASNHRMSKSGVDTSPYLYTFVASCSPA